MQAQQARGAAVRRLCEDRLVAVAGELLDGVSPTHAQRADRRP